MGNKTLILPDRNYNTVILAVTSVFGFVIFIENAILLVFRCKLLTKYKSGKEQFDVITQVVFVCANDTFSSFVLFMIGVLRVTYDITARLCVYTILLSSTLQAMSQSNIMCICEFRLYAAIPTCELDPKRHKLLTLVLVSVNVTVGLTFLAPHSVNVKLTPIMDGADMACGLVAGMISKSTIDISSIYLVVGFIVTIIADVLCGMTEHRLKREIRHVQPMTTTSTSTSEPSISTGTHTTCDGNTKTHLVLKRSLH